jgi:hypothetical protein
MFFGKSDPPRPPDPAQTAGAQQSEQAKLNLSLLANAQSSRFNTFGAPIDLSGSPRSIL